MKCQNLVSWKKQKSTNLLSAGFVQNMLIYDAMKPNAALKQNVCCGKCPKISYTKVSDKMVYANSADPDQTAPEGAV